MSVLILLSMNTNGMKIFRIGKTQLELISGKQLEIRDPAVHGRIGKLWAL